MSELLAWRDRVIRSLRDLDLDCIVLLTGDPGNGKSTLMLQLAVMFHTAQFESRFSLDHVHFAYDDDTMDAFIDDARQLPRFGVIAADEFRMHRRHHATKASKKIVDFFQISRGLNLIYLICFPHAGAMDRELLDFRVRYKIDVQRGIATLYERKTQVVSDINGEENYVTIWVKLFSWRFAANSGEFWEEYLARKITAARKREAKAKGEDDWTALEVQTANEPLREKARANPKGRLSEEEWKQARKKERGGASAHKGSQPKFLMQHLAKKGVTTVPHSALREKQGDDAPTGAL